MRLPALAVVIAAELSACAFAQVDEPPRAGYANVDIALQESGEQAVGVWQIKSKHRVLSQHLSSRPRSMAMRPGTYVLEIDCWRAGGWTVVDGAPQFVVTVREERRYLLDCAPTTDYENNFSLTERN